MPKVPSYTAQGGRFEVPSSPDYIRGDNGPEEAIGSFGANVQRSTNMLTDQFVRLNRQEAQSDFQIMRGLYDAQVKNIQNELSSDPTVLANPKSFGEEFRKRVSIILPDLDKSTSNADARALFKQYYAQQFPQDLVNANTVGGTLYAKKESAKLDVISDQLSTRAAEAVDERSQQEAVDDYYKRIDSAVKDGLMFKEVGESKKQEFGVKATKKWMNVMRQRDPTAMIAMEREGAFNLAPEADRLATIKRAAEDLDRTDKKNEKLAKDYSDKTEQALYAQANFRLITSETEKLLLEGSYPGITAQKGREIVAANRRAIGGNTELDEIAKRLEEEFDYEASSLTRIRKFRERAVELSRNSTIRSEELGKFLKRLNTLENTETSELRALDAQGRAQKSEQEREMSRKVDAAMLEYDVRYKKRSGPGSDFAKNRMFQEKREIEKRIRSGESREQIFSDLEKRKAKRLEDANAPSTIIQKTLEELKRGK